jgi:hypothetical protein
VGTGVPTSCHLSSYAGTATDPLAFWPSIVHALGRWEAWVSRVTPERPTATRRRVDVEVEARRIGDNRIGACRIGRRPRGHDTGVRAGELQPYGDGTFPVAGLIGPWMCAAVIVPGRLNATTW